MHPFQLRDDLHAPDPAWLAQSGQEGVFRQRRLALAVGLVAFALTPAMLVIDGLNGPACAGGRNSISHYVYEPVAGTVFVMALGVIGTLLLAWRGENRVDAWVSAAAGLAAFVVALVPTLGPGCAEGLLDVRAATLVTIVDGTAGPAGALDFSTPQADGAHLWAAIALFAVLFYFALVIFTRVRPVDRGPDGRLTPEKRLRNTIYVVSAVAMAVGGWLIWQDGGPPILGLPPVLLGEGLALTAFGVAWLVKGRVLGRWLGP